jgi:hypothetical protein
MSKEPGPEYEAPTVEEVKTEDAPAVTAAGADSLTDVDQSDLRLKRTLRPLEETLTRCGEMPKSGRIHPRFQVEEM